MTGGYTDPAWPNFTSMKLTTDSYPPDCLRVTRTGRHVMTITHDGKIEVGEGYTPSEAGDAFIAALPQAFGHAIKAAAEQERAAIVAWLRADTDTYPHGTYERDNEVAQWASYFSEAIERGEHLPPPPE